ncbi:HNH endonuclease signature motif containing protein [Paeniglutamicibacter psychrophenolicus]|uniref:HNH endonuclease signature motif containing protein n=1 Tax=Paeniglutamicibacter psychrophenolicus TaxID=257454 RepID=UPI00278943BA|nr:HNH endonuclease signature motif containing protein [Paeniglutamicibacter psychrophenolicus]MDQ0094731.1 hypothetical protein [Paeniglutamicibacter psychrophenolicus]
MATMAMLANAGLAGLQQFMASSTEGTDTSASESPVDDQLRLLALLNPLLKTLVDEIAGSVTTSPVRAATLALLIEDLGRTIGRAQIVAAGKIEESDAHTLKEEPLALLHQVHGNLADFIEGTISLPADQCNSPGTKMLFKDATEMLKEQLHLSFSQSRERLATRDLLLARTGFNGSVVPPRFAVLSRVLDDGTADPQQVAMAARRLLALQPGIDAQPDPGAAAELIERQVAESLVSRNPAGTTQLFKRISARLDAQALERGEARMLEHLSLDFKGKQARGYVWELCTDVQGHETLLHLSDQLANPRSAFGNTPSPAPDPGKKSGSDAGSGSSSGSEGQEPLPGLSEPGSSPEAPPIPAWAIDPQTPDEQRPRAGFTDLGRGIPATEGAPGLELLPGESTAEARARAKARALYQFVFDSMRYAADGESPGAPTMPMKPQVEMIVTISWDALVGKLNDPGITAHNQLVSPGYARRLACSANILPAVLGTRSQPLDLGRTQRLFNRAQRRAMMIRDKGCINPGCTMASHRCEANHIKPWYLGGETNLANGALLCPICHASFHAGHFKIVVVDSIPYVLQSTARDPEQRLRRNWIFHPEAEAAA